MSHQQDFSAMDDAFFRMRVRHFVNENYPPELRNPPKRLHWRDNMVWYMTLARKGWLAPGWPREYGGMGLSPSQQIILIEEYERHGVARTNDHGIVMVGPLVIQHGTTEQKARFLPAILSGEHIWCQGYSEPNAGSDLASLSTEAKLDGDSYVVNGQKTWCTLGTDANWIFLLARTDKSAKKQDGISFLLVDMTSPGITVRPIVNLEMHDEFSEVFFENVRVPVANLVGAPNSGWTIAKAMLGFERIFLGSPRQSAYALERLREMAERKGLWEQPEFMDTYARLYLDLEDAKTLYEHFVAQLKRGETLGPDVSMLKIIQSELYQRITNTMIEFCGEEAVEPLGNESRISTAGLFLNARPTTIYGGSSEIQRNILAKNVLDLPT